jgi:hypothetical protein
MAHDVFISYSSKDKPVADAVCAGLEARGIRCWVAPRDIMPGVDWGAAIIDAIAGARVMVLIFSGNANTSQQIKREVERAVAKNVKIVPFRIEDVAMSKSLEYFVSSQHWLDALTQPLEGHVARLGDTVSVLVKARETGPPPPIPQSARPSQPVPGTPWTPSSPPRPIPPLVPPYRPSKTPLVLIVAGAIAVAALYLVLHKASPEIVAINFPTSFAAGRSDVTGTVQFKAGHDPIAQAEFAVVSAQSFDPFTIQPRGIAGEKLGSFAFTIHSSIPQQVILRATLIDAQGRRSSPVSFSFEAKKSSAAQKRSIDIETPQGFKFKIPH